MLHVRPFKSDDKQSLCAENEKVNLYHYSDPRTFCRRTCEGSLHQAIKLIQHNHPNFKINNDNDHGDRHHNGRRPLEKFHDDGQGDKRYSN